MANTCSIVKNPPYIVNFLATVRIPAGYKIQAIPNYDLYLTLDSTNVKTDRLFENKEVIVTIGTDVNGNPITMPCTTKIIKLDLHGTLYSNLVVSTFETVNAVTAQSLTAFSGINAIPIDTVLGYACPDCDFPDDALFGYTTELTKLDEFIITASGTQIFYNPADPEEFFEALSDATTSQVIQVPYTLTITPSSI